MEEDNKLIAEFMGAIKCDGGWVGDPHEMDYYLFSKNKIIHQSKLEYHKSWGWLIPVCSKILNETKNDITLKLSNALKNGAGKSKDVWKKEIFDIVMEYLKLKNEKKD